MKSDDDLLLDIEAHYKRARDHSDKWRAEAREDYDFVSGVQWSEEDAALLSEQGRVGVTFNRVAPVIDAVAGAEVSNRQEVRYIPRETGDAKVNEILTAGAKWVRDECNAEDEESDAFCDAVICGMGWTETHVEYDDDPDGKVYIDRVDPLEMYWDSAAKKHNISDARWILRVKKYSRDALAAQWGATKIDGIIADLDKTERELGADEDLQGEPHNATDAWKYKNDASGAGKVPAFKVREYQWYESERVYRVPNPQSGQLEDVEVAAFEKLKPALEAAGVPFTDVKPRKAYRAYALGKNILESGPGPGDTRFTYNAITAKRDRNRGYWHGLVRPMKDPQRWANKFFSQILHIVNSHSKGGLLIEQGAAKSLEQVKEEWARADGVIELNPGGLDKLREKTQGQYPTGIDRMMEVAVSAIRDVTGVNLEMLGLADRTQAGVLEYQRKQAGLTILASLFDALRRYRKDQGRLLLTFIRKYVADGRLIRVVGEQGAQYVPLALDKQTARFDIVVDDSPTSPNQKEQVFGVMSSLMPMLTKIGVAPPAEALDYLPLPSSLVEKWKAQIAQAAQQPNPEAQAAQAAQAAEQQKMQADQQTEAQRQAFEGQKLQAEAQAEQQKSQLDLELKRAEYAIKVQEMQDRQAQREHDRAMAEAQCAHERDSMMAEHRDRNAERTIKAREAGIDARDVVEGAEASPTEKALLQLQATIVQEGRAQTEALAARLEQIAQMLVAPRQIIRNADNEIVGADINGVRFAVQRNAAGIAGMTPIGRA